MKVLFILPESNAWERLGVMSLSASLKKDHHEVDLVFADPRRLNKVMMDYQPDIVGYSVMTGEHTKVLELNQRLKQDYQFRAVFGGPHATFYPQLIQEQGCDAVCVGEGDIAFTEFCRRLERGEEYWKTPNFNVKHNGSIYNNPPMDLVENLDDLPFPDRELMYKTDPALKRDGRKMFFGGRGCPYQCTYCFNNEYNQIYKKKGAVVRYRSSKNLIDEICRVKEDYPMKYVHIEDDTFLLKPIEWTKDFCEDYKERVGLPIFCNVRANLVTEENIALLKDAGLYAVCIGIECGDEEVSNSILKRNLSNEKILKATTIIKKHGIKLITQTIAGLPVHNSYETDRVTLDLITKIRPTWGQSSILYPYPGTPIHAYAKEQGFLKENLFLETNKHSTTLSFPPQEKRKIENLHKLFGIFVEFPFLQRYCNFFCSLPLKRLYIPLFYVWYGIVWKVKLFPFRSVREYFQYLGLFFRMIKKT